MINKLHYITSRGFKVRPTHNTRGKYCVEIVDEYNLIYKNKINQGEYKHTDKSFQEAQLKTIDWIYDKLIEKKL